ncbi:phage tail tape measure protein [Paenibacillus sp. PL2-23]|uniref:phage tail tape measure protein n=1 Tax=Paenibacillus sp. PL2-23 TaxID=2100729 RepID=UPI0030F5BC90
MKKGIVDLGEEGKRTSKSFDGMNAAVAKIAANTNHLKAIEQQLKKIDPAKMEQGFAAVVAELQKMGAEQKQIEALEQALAEMSQQAQTADTRVGQLEEELKQLGARRPDIDKVNEGLKDTDNAAGKAGQGVQALAAGIAGLGAGAALAKLVSTVQTLSNEANQLASSYRGLSVVANKFNVDTEASVELADKLADRWGLNKALLADTVKTYLTMNLSLEETERIITATTDAAAYNRQSHLSWGEAIKQVAEGVKSGNSNLTDAAGITTNLSVMQDRYAKSIGTTAAKLTEAQKVQAAFNGMLEEGAIFAGNADDTMTGFTGTQASFQSTLQEARVELGEAFIPALERILELLTPMIKGFTTWTSENNEMVAGLIAAVAAVLALTAVVGALIAAFVALNAVMGPIGWVILGISALTVGVTAYAAAADAAATSQENFNELLEKSPLSRNASEVKEMQSKIESLNEILNKRNAIMREYEQRMKDAEQGRGSIENTHAIFDLADAIKSLDKELKGMGYSAEEAEQAVKDMTSAVSQSIPALLELNRSERTELQTKVAKIKATKELREKYDELSSAEKLSAERSAELKDVVNKLAKEYPQLNKYIDDSHRIHEDGILVLDNAIGAEERYYGRKAELLAADLKVMLENAKAEKAIIDARIASLDEFTKKAQKAPDNLPPAARMAARTSARLADEEAELARESSDAYALAIAQIEGAIAGSDINNRGKGSNGLPIVEEEKKSGTKLKTKAELEREALQESLKLLEYKRNMDFLTEQQEVDSLERLRKKYQHNADIRMELEVRIHQLKKQMGADEEKRREEETKKTEQAARERFEHSSNWILQEERRMVLAGESEEVISKMKLEAWTRVRSRYAKDNDYYKQADTQLYNLRVELIRKTEKAQQEAAREQETLTKEAVKSALDAIDKAKRAELAALDDRRKAIEAFYDDQAEAIDDSERLKERNELVAEMEKYRFATSERGQKTFLELQEKLRQMDVEQQKRNLDKSREQELAALDRQKQDIETFYDELRTATEDLTGDLTSLYKLADDERLKSFRQTNELIKQEMAALQQMLSSYQSSIAVPPSSGGGGSSGIDASKIAQMQANSAAWHSADAAGKKQLSEANKAIGSSMGANYNSAEGRWYKNGVPIYHVGGVAGEMNFRSPEMLMPDEINAILRRGETVMTPEQVDSLVAAASGQSTGRTVMHNYYGPFIENSGDVHLEDDTDIESYYREQEHLVRQMIARGERADG